MLAEQQTEWLINNNLLNKGWCIDGADKRKNVYFQTPRLATQRKALACKRPDYLLYETGSDKIIAIIEAKRGGVDLTQAIQQACGYAETLGVPLAFATNGSYWEARFVATNKPLMRNGEEVNELLAEVDALKFVQAQSHKVYTLPKQVILSRSELIKIFKEANDTLRSEGLRAGIERFSEFANLLFLKLLSEHAKESWWELIKAQQAAHTIGFINDYVLKQIADKYGGGVFMPVAIQNPNTLREIINKLDPLVLSTMNTDVKGDAFEYFLQQTTSTHNDLGEYFTPRHIVKAVIDLIAPRFGEKIYDPFCGTGGFLIGAFNYIKQNNIIHNAAEITQLKEHTLYGREITTTARIAKMSMILYGDGHSGVEQCNSLGNPLDQQYDVVVSNIPFSQKAAAHSGLYYNGIAKQNGDAACILHCLRALKPGGRMALIVPEGFLFRKNMAPVRKLLLSKARLACAISLPTGAFLPYTNVKTTILYFTNAHQPNKQQHYAYYSVENDGYTLDSRRKRTLGGSDLHRLAASDFRRLTQDGASADNMRAMDFTPISLKQVKQQEWSLVGSQYSTTPSTSQLPMVRLGDIC
jgi:type I restriction enzyme M protein